MFNYQLEGNEIVITGIEDDSVKELRIPDQIDGFPVTKIGMGAFFGCSSLTGIKIPDSVTEIGEGAFFGCSSLIEIKIPDGVTKIENLLFFGCFSLTKIEIPDSITEIGEIPFVGCSSLTTMDVSPNNPVFKGVDNVLFSKDGKVLIFFPRGKKVEEYQIPDGVIRIGCEAFSNSFLAPQEMEMMTNSIKDNSDFFFYGCPFLTAIKIPDSVTEIADGIFAGCPSLTMLDVSPNNPNFKSIDNALFSKDGKVLICFPEGKKENRYQIPDGVTRIRDAAFSGCSSLTKIKIPDSVTEIGEGAFSNCFSLIIFGKHGSYAEEYAYQNGIPFVDRCLF